MTHPPTRVCAGCGAISGGRRWYRHDSSYAQKAKASPGRLRVAMCPRCRTGEPRLPHGYVHIDGSFASAHRADIEALIHRVAVDVQRELPSASLLACEDDGAGGLLATTSLGHVAVRIGQALEQRYDGQLHFGVVPGRALSHVWWSGCPDTVENAGDRGAAGVSQDRDQRAEAEHLEAGPPPAHLGNRRA